jgi:hypothetical protein
MVAHILSELCRRAVSRPHARHIAALACWCVGSLAFCAGLAAMCEISDAEAVPAYLGVGLGASGTSAAFGCGASSPACIGSAIGGGWCHCLADYEWQSDLEQGHAYGLNDWTFLGTNGTGSPSGLAWLSSNVVDHVACDAGDGWCLTLTAHQGDASAPSPLNWDASTYITDAGATQAMTSGFVQETTAWQVPYALEVEWQVPMTPGTWPANASTYTNNCLGTYPGGVNSAIGTGDTNPTATCVFEQGMYGETENCERETPTAPYDYGQVSYVCDPNTTLQFTSSGLDTGWHTTISAFNYQIYADAGTPGYDAGGLGCMTFYQDSLQLGQPICSHTGGSDGGLGCNTGGFFSPLPQFWAADLSLGQESSYTPADAGLPVQSRIEHVRRYCHWNATLMPPACCLTPGVGGCEQ